jgi:predicted RNA binding protein YcfA (HicA-like mRNA interferase family)
MPRLPRITGKALIAALEKAGFVVRRIRGSHHFLKHEDGRTTTVPVHRGETIGPGLLTKILRDCELTVDELNALLKEK